MAKVHLIYSLLLVLSGPVFSQSIPIVTADLNGEKINIQYDLVGMEGEVYNVNIYSSLDDFTSPLENTQGDLGVQRPGYQKLIVWEAKKQLGFYSGDLTFEIRAEKVYEPLRIMGPFPKMGGNLVKYKTKSKMEISWQGGAPGETVTISLLQGDSAGSFTEVAQIGQKINDPKGNIYDWKIPKKMESAGESKKIATAKNYVLKLTGSSQYSNDKFAKGYFIKRSSPLPGLITLAVIGGGLVAADYFLELGFIFPPIDDPDDPIVDPVDEPLPNPPSPN